VLQHELAHLRRGDALWSLLGELMLALLWFHPLAWLALPRLRLDQELACDERVLRQSPQDASSYAHTLLHSTGVDAMPMFIPWLSQPQLKERLNMIQRPRPGTLRRHIGFLAIAMLMTSAAFAAQAATGHSKHATDTSSKPIGYVTNTPPKYPADAAKNKEQGTVVLLILVGADGHPKSLTVDPKTHATPEMIKAASDAVMTWRFTPRMEQGKAVEGYAKVPVTFSIHDDPPATPPAGSSAATSPSV
jgi:TonB family protein